MGMTEASRRKFLVESLTGISATWIAANWSAASAAGEKAQEASPGRFTYFSPAQAAEIDAISAQIFPTTDTPGAREAQVVYFIDLALVTFAKDAQPIYAKGLADLHARTTQMFADAKSFSSLSSPQQIQLLTTIETTPFFQTLRNHTVMGLFASPQHGGNFNKVGWKLIGFDDSLNFRAPFGAYDKA